MSLFDPPGGGVFLSSQERQTIDDDEMEDSPTDTSELWMPDRNDEDTKFVRAKGDAIELN